MAKFKKMFLVTLLIGALVFAFNFEAQAQSQPYQITTTPKYVGHTAYDTVSLPGLSTSSKSGIITNEGPSKLIIFFTKRGLTTIDSTSFFILDTGRTLKFTTNGTKILRKALADSCYSQVLLGGVELMNNLSTDPGELMTVNYINFTPYNRNWEADRMSCFKMPTWSGTAGGVLNCNTVSFEKAEFALRYRN